MDDEATAGNGVYTPLQQLLWCCVHRKGTVNGHRTCTDTKDKVMNLPPADIHATDQYIAGMDAHLTTVLNRIRPGMTREQRIMLIFAGLLEADPVKVAGIAAAALSRLYENESTRA